MLQKLFDLKWMCLTLLLVSAMAVPVSAQSIAYTDATIETASSAGPLVRGTLVIEDGKIVDIGSEVEIPIDARIVPMNGKTIMPVLVDPYFVFQTVSGGNGESRTVTFNGRTITIPNRGGGSNVSPFAKISEYFYPYDFDFRPARRTGIGIVNLVSNGQGLSAFATLEGEPAPEMIFQPEGVVFAQVTNQTASLDQIRRPLAPTRGAGRSGRSGGRPSGGGNAAAGASNNSAAEEASPWDAVKKGEKPVFINASNSASIAHVLAFMKDQPKVPLVLVATGANLYELIDPLSEMKNVKVVLEPGIDRVPYTNDLMNVSSLLVEKKIPFAISMSLSNSQLNASQDDPLFPLAILVKTGLSRQQALESVTIRGAEMMGIEKEYGSLEKGKVASFLIFDGDPLKTGSQLKQVVMNGVTVHEN